MNEEMLNEENVWKNNIIKELTMFGTKQTPGLPLIQTDYFVRYLRMLHGGEFRINEDR